MKAQFIIEPIGIIRSCFTEKFGIPRQAGLAPSAEATVELTEGYNREEMVRGLENYSHIWVQFIFHQALKAGWKTTVRPPRMGGKERLGVFATRSPHRPNHLGISAVRLEQVHRDDLGIKIDVSGADLLDGTPVVDIKPYIPYSDLLSAARMDVKWEDMPEFDVVMSPETEIFCREYESSTGRKLRSLISEIVKQDPRPASQKMSRAEFGMCLWDVNVRWRVDGSTCRVLSCSRLSS